MKIILTTIFLFFVSSHCLASNNFKCLVKDAVSLESNGLLSREPKVAKSNIGKEFIVNRVTGHITGSGYTNTMSGQQPLVYDYLPSENGYKAITIYKPNHTVDYLQINEYVEGKEKPFFYKGAWGEMVSGVCVYY